MHSPQFGGQVRKEDLEKFKESKHWSGDKFENFTKTAMDFSLGNVLSLIKENIVGRKSRAPQSDLPIQKFDHTSFNVEESDVSFVWYGHSALLLRISGINILIDPMLGNNASPVGPIATTRYSTKIEDSIDQLPEIDAVLLTHDHYDHLDYGTIQKIKSKVPIWFTALGVSRHLEKWGIPKSKITEFDWWDEITFRGVRIVFTPSRHFSGRGLFDRAKSLWGGWVIQSDEHRIYWSGDGGYGDHFKEVGARLGPFDIGFMECGQYNERWHAIHMYPEEAVQAAIEARVSVAMPVHWGAFTLALHTWTDPASRFCASAERNDVAVTIPQLGQVFKLSNTLISHRWWESI